MTTYGITGSTGHVGAMVAERLAEQGVPMRLIVRDAKRAPSYGEATVAVADYSDLDASTAALLGVDTLFMVSAAEAVDRREHHRTFISAAKAAGVKRIVYTSFSGASPAATFTLGRDHADAEAAIRETGIPYTFLRDSLYSDFLPMMADESGVIRGPAGDGRLAGVARADVAESAAAVLLDPVVHENITYTLTGPEALTLTETAARMSAASGRRFSFENETVEEAYASRAHYGAPDWQVDAWVSTYTAIAAGEVSQVTGDVQKLTGHAARSIEDLF